MDGRHLTGARGERAAAWFLGTHGVEITDRNVRVGRGEVDLIGTDGRRRVVFEVRTSSGDLRLDDRFDHAKKATVRHLAARLGIGRVDLVGVALRPDGLRFHWLRGVPLD